MRKLLALLLTVAMLFSVISVLPTAVAAEEMEFPVVEETEIPDELKTEFGVEEVDDAIEDSDDDSDSGVLYAEREKYAGDKDNSLEKMIENYEAPFASALSAYVDIPSFRNFLIDAFDTCTTSNVNIYSYRIPVSKWDDLCNIVFYDVPELFHVTTLGGRQDGTYITAIYVSEYPTYCDTASEYATLYNRSVEVASQLLVGIRNNNNLTDLQKMILLHDRIATYCEYDPNQLSNGEYRDQDYTMTGVFVDKVAVCQGYANAYNYLLREIGVDSYQCRSTALCHAWNLVKVGSYYYHVDITWDDTYSDALDLKGRVFHTNFLRSNNGIYNGTGHKASDYDRPTNDSSYDSYFWQNSDTEFVVVGNTVYYYDKTCGDLKNYSGTVKSNQATWAYGRILADGNYIYITTSGSVLRYDTTTGSTSTVYTPSLSSGHEIYGLYKNGSNIYCTAGSTSSSTQTTYQIGSATPDTPSATALTANNSYSASITTGGQEKVYSFTPTTSGKYVIYSTGSDDTKVYLCSSNGNEIESDDDGGDSTNFRLEYNLTAGTTYLYKVKYYNSSKTGTISFKFGKVFSISYNANGGSGAPSMQEMDYGTSVTLSDTIPTRSGYIFKGWATSSSATAATYQPGDTYSANASVTLYAVWGTDTTTLTANGSYSANITYGGQEKIYRFTPTTSGQYVIYSTGSDDTYVTLCDNSGNELAYNDDGDNGYNFRLAYDLTAGRTYQYKVRFLSSSTTGTISFKFGNIFTITYNANGGNNAPYPQEKDYGMDIVLSSNVPSRIGYEFVGWATSSSSTTVAYRPGDTYSANANITLYAIWETDQIGNYPLLEVNKGYYVNIDSGYVRAQFTPTKTAKYIVHSNNISSSSDSQDTKVWLYDENGVLLASDDDSGDGLNFKLIYELVAGRTYIFEFSFYNQSHGGYFEFIFGQTYTITYSANGGKSAPGTGVNGYMDTTTLSTWLPSRSGYVFLGWSTNKKATSATYKRGGELPSSVNKNITLYAIWKKGSLGATAVFKGKLIDYNTVKVYWRAVPGADAYKVYYKKASAKSYKSAGMVTGTSFTSDFTAGTKYNFKVVPCIRKNDGKYTDGKAKTLTYTTGRLFGAPSWLTATHYGYDDIQLKWSKVQYASHYKIYYKKNNASSYTYKGVTKSTSYKMANLADGARYTFAVLPCLYVNGAYLEATHYRWIETYTLKKVATPTIEQYSSTRINIYWPNIAGESGYQISKSTSSKGTNVIYTGTVSSYDTYAYYYKDVSAPYGKTYYYKVRAFVVANGKKIYGPWSTAVKYRNT